MKQINKFALILIIYCILPSCDTIRLDKDERLVNKITAQTAKKIETEKNLKLIGTGGGMMHGIRMLSMSFQYYHEVNLEQARSLVVYATQEYLSAINSNEEIQKYLQERPFPAKRVEIQIWICQDDGLRPPPSKIDYISSIDGIIQYYIYRPGNSSRESICKETYQEALQKLSNHVPKSSPTNKQKT